MGFGGFAAAMFLGVGGGEGGVCKTRGGDRGGDGGCPVPPEAGGPEEEEGWLVPVKDFCM